MAMPLTPIPGLRQSVLPEVAALLYRRHVESEPGECGTCRQAGPCPAQLRAELRTPTAGSALRQLEDVLSPRHTGYGVGGRAAIASGEGSNG
jgi:hypothetical protein